MKTELIPRKVFFSNPDKASVQLSPDGVKIAYLAPLDGVLNVWVGSRENVSDAIPVTHDTGRGIRIYIWAHTNKHILYLQDKNGDENWRLFCLDLQSQKIMDLTPFEGVQVDLKVVSEKKPDEVVAAINNRDPQWHDLYKINIITGELTLLEKNEGVFGYIVDDTFQVHRAMQMTPDGGASILKMSRDTWVEWETIGAEDFLTTTILGFDKTKKCIYMKDSRGRNTSALVIKDLESKETTLIWEDPRADIDDVLIHPKEKTVQAVSSVFERKSWKVIDKTIESDLKYLNSISDGEVEIISRTLEDKFWVVLYKADNGPARYYLYDRLNKNARFLFTNREELASYRLQKMYSVVIKSRDGLDLTSYYTLPPETDSNQDGIPDQPQPMILFPHGGPWGRDYWGYNPIHQWLANRGYVVLAVNFRSSTGIGKNFTNAGDLEWGGKIIEDQVDAVEWAIRNKIADPEKIGIMGGSFGGYSTLAGLTFYPDLYACGVDLVGPSNLLTLINSIPPYWKPMLDLFKTRMGDHTTEDGRMLLEKHSPLTYVDRIQKPLLIGQGANDPRVKQTESDQIVNAMKGKNIPVTYILYPDEGHGFARPENNLSFFAIAEAFLAKYLRGQYQHVGDDFSGSSLLVITGIEGIPGLEEAVQAL